MPIPWYVYFRLCSRSGVRCNRSISAAVSGRSNSASSSNQADQAGAGMDIARDRDPSPSGFRDRPTGGQLTVEVAGGRGVGFTRVKVVPGLHEVMPDAGAKRRRRNALPDLLALFQRRRRLALGQLGKQTNPQVARRLAGCKVDPDRSVVPSRARPEKMGPRGPLRGSCPSRPSPQRCRSAAATGPDRHFSFGRKEDKRAVGRQDADFQSAAADASPVRDAHVLFVVPLADQLFPLFLRVVGPGPQPQVSLAEVAAGLLVERGIKRDGFAQGGIIRGRDLLATTKAPISVRNVADMVAT